MRQVLTVFRLLEAISNFEDEACRRFGCRFAGRVLQALLRHCAVETLLPISPVSDVSLAGSRPPTRSSPSLDFRSSATTALPVAP